MASPRELDDRACVREAFGDRLTLAMAERFGELLAAPKPHAERAIARKISRTGQNQVAQSGEPRDGFGTCSQRGCEPGELGDSARDYRSAGAGAESQSIADPGCDRNYVLD